MRVALLFSFIALAACHERQASNDATEVANQQAPSQDDTSNVDPVMACAHRGVAYFKQMGSYPTLKSAPNIGRAAEDVALERCQRTTTAFP